jgi:hypothetical protein
MKLQIETFDFPMTIVTDALHSLPPASQSFINDVLAQKCGKVNRWGWYNIEWVFGSNKRYVELCSIGSPPKDISYVWVYNVETSQYELWQTQYHLPISLLDKQLPEDTAHTFHELLSKLMTSLI